MKSLVKITSSSVAVALCIGASLLAWGGEGASPRAINGISVEATAGESQGWHDMVIEDEHDLRLRHAIADGKGGLWVLYTRREKRSAMDEGDLYLMRIDSSGRRTADTGVVMPAAPVTRRSGSAVAMALGADGRPAVLTSTDTGIAVIEPAVERNQVLRSRSLDIDAWPLSLQAAGEDRFRVVTNKAVMLWSGQDEPQVEFAAGESQVFAAAGPAPEGFVVLHALVSDGSLQRVRAGRMAADDPGAVVLRRIDQLGPAAALYTRFAADRSSLAVFGPVEKGPPSRWQSTVFDRDMNVVHAGLVTLPFEVNLETALALQPLESGGQLLASVNDGKLWLARLDTDGELHSRETPGQLLPSDGNTHLMPDMQWVDVPGNDRAILVSTVIVFDPTRDAPDHALWFASIGLRD